MLCFKGKSMEGSIRINLDVSLEQFTALQEYLLEIKKEKDPFFQNPLSALLLEIHSKTFEKAGYLEAVGSKFSEKGIIL